MDDPSKYNEKSLDDATTLLVERTTEAYLRRWTGLLGVANLGVIIAGMAYIFLILPQQATRSAIDYAAPEIQKKTDELVSSSRKTTEDLVSSSEEKTEELVSSLKKKTEELVSSSEDSLDQLLKQSETRLTQIESRIFEAVGKAGKLEGATESIQESASELRSSALKLRSSLDEAQAFFEAENFEQINEATKFLQAFSSSDSAGLIQRVDGLASELSDLRKKQEVFRVLLSETEFSAPWPGGTITNEQYENFWGPFDIETEGGDLLVLFDSAFSGLRTERKRAWIRLLVDDQPRRVIQAYSSVEWTLSSLVLNDLIKGLNPGSHKLELEVKVQEGAVFTAPLNNADELDESSRQLIVIELPNSTNG